MDIQRKLLILQVKHNISDYKSTFAVKLIFGRFRSFDEAKLLIVKLDPPMISGGCWTHAMPILQFVITRYEIMPHTTALARLNNHLFNNGSACIVIYIII